MERGREIKKERGRKREKRRGIDRYSHIKRDKEIDR
jgi:hypothetical protein